MDTAIIVSAKDPAGLNIRENLLELFAFREKGNFEGNPVHRLGTISIYTINEFSVFREHIDRKIDADLFVFATKHQARSKIPSLSVHTPGNWAKAEFGGIGRRLCIAPAAILRESYIELCGQAKKEDKTKEFDVVMECTHHGPYIEKPALFIEIGSSEEQWGIKEAGKVIAGTIMEVLGRQHGTYRAAFGIGGLHTCPNFNRVVLETDIAVGHVCPRYMLGSLDREMVLQAIEKTKENVDFVLLDWKGLGTEKQRIVKILDEIGIEHRRTREF